jgi:hypothetical protein
MHILSVFTVFLLSVCSTLATYVNLESFNDGTYAYANYFTMDAEPSPQDQAAYAKAGYDEMVTLGANDGIETPNTMSAAWWPNRSGTGGTLILHSSIKVSHAHYLLTTSKAHMQ